jgi:hypothetical protein
MQNTSTAQTSAPGGRTFSAGNTMRLDASVSYTDCDTPDCFYCRCPETD